MTHYKISKEELESFAKKVYEEACYGYLDLKDSVCDGMIRDFLDGRKILPPIDTNIMAGPPPGPVGAPPYSGMGYTMGGRAYSGTEGMLSGSYGTSTVTITGDGSLTPPRSSANSLTPPRPDGPPDPGPPEQQSFEWEITTDSINDIPVPSSVATGRDSPENRGIQMRATSGHHIELRDDMPEVRPETNFQGNESERF